MTIGNFTNTSLSTNISKSPGTQWSFRGCVYDAAGNVQESLTGTATAQPNHHIFATHNTYQGNLAAAYSIWFPFATGLEGADRRCQDAATSVNNKYNYQGNWKAVLSTSTTNAKDRLVILGPIYNVAISGTTRLVASNAAQLWGAPLSTNIYYDEFGNMSNAGAWTGSTVAGTADTNNNCTSWTDDTSSGNGRVGQVGSTSSQWLSYSAYPCDATYSLYCIDQP